MAASAFDTAFAAANPTFLNAFGEAVSYTPGGGSPRNISMMFEANSLEQRNTGVQTSECSVMMAEVSTRNDTEGVSNPVAAIYGGATGDALVRLGVTWYVVALVGDVVNGMQKLKLCTKEIDPDRLG